ncbi:urea transporter [Barrientosiimonas marina]|uniref:Urea transporter n=1 Tax=Lentibacillus kimchii TaxID=1542911 RepID=A0ABW2UUQ5_9BACI
MTIKPVQLINMILKGVSQVVLIENSITGIFIIAGLMATSLSLGVLAIVSSCIGTLIGIAGGDSESAQSGLFGFNSVLTGLALFIYLDGPYTWLFAIIGAAIAGLLNASVMHILGQFKMPAITFPFILVTWLFVIAAYQLHILDLSNGLAPESLASWTITPTGDLHWFEGMVRGVGQIFLQDFFWTGFIILAGIFWAGWTFGLYAVASTVLAFLTAYIMGADMESLNSGIYGYNAVLTIIAVAAVFDVKTDFAPVTGLIGVILSVPVTAAVHSLLLPYGLPVLTLPFVLTTWTLLAARQVLVKI